MAESLRRNWPQSHNIQKMTTLTLQDASLTASSHRRLALVIVGNALMRIAGSASGVLVGLFLADLANRGFRVNAALVGTLGAISFGAELIGAVPWD